MEEQKVDQPLSELIKSYITGRRDDKVVKLLKDKPDKKGKGGINQKLIKKIEKVSKGNIELDNKLTEITKAKKAKNETDLSFQLKRYDNLLSLANACAGAVDIEYDIAEFERIRKEYECEYDCNTWISREVENAERVSLATHVIKLTHSGIKDASCFNDKSTVTSNLHVTTSHIKNKTIDGSYDDAKFSPIASFLQLVDEGGTLANKILINDYSALAPFANSSEQLDTWVSCLKKTLDNPKKKSHYLAKQVYFPVKNNEYHLLANIPSSSLAQELFERFKQYWSEEAKETRECKNNNKYSSELCVSYPGKAVIKITASQHQNASILNGKRSGQILMLSCQPPVWQSRLNPPINKSSLFYTEVQYSTRDSVRKLQRLLLAVKANELSINNPNVHANLSTLVEEIIEVLFQYVSSIHNLENQTGWSRAAKRLKLAHQLWLDPFREDEEFQQKRNTMEWQDDICSDFSLWLNNRLKHKQLTLGKPQETFWQKIMRPRLRAFNAITEVSR